MTDDQLQFIDYRKPKLEAGYYQFDAKQRFQGESSSDKMQVCVAGERVSIDPKFIFAQYPPPGEKGDFSDTIPHISFTKGSLPWIRSAYDKDDELDAGENYEIYEPWLYLLTTNQNDVEEGSVRLNGPIPLEELNKGVYFPLNQKASLIADISLPAASKTVRTIDVKKSLFNKLILNGRLNTKDKDQLEYLAHIRRRWQPVGDEIRLMSTTKADLNSGDLSKLAELDLPRGSSVSVISKDRGWLVQNSLKGDMLIDAVPTVDNHFVVQKMSLKRELSVLVSNRFGQSATSENASRYPGGLENTASVLSLESYLTEAVLSEIRLLSDNDYLRFIVLTSWDFYCQPAKINFEERAKALDVNAFKLPDRKIQQANDFSDRLQAGLVAVPHQYRQGAKSISWYRGPLSPTTMGDFSTIQLSELERCHLNNSYSATDADKLLRFHKKEGMFDITYSAAYELGRFLSFKNSQFLSALTQYKRARSRYVTLTDSDEVRNNAAAQRGINIARLPYAKLDETEMESQKSDIHQWLMELGDLSAVPNWYLIPDPDLLPSRCLRVFSIDPKWIQSLWLGALSLNGRPDITYALFEECHQALWNQLPQHGVLLRSDIVWAYPELMVEMRNVGDASTHLNLDLETYKGDNADEYTDFIEQQCPLSPITIKRDLAKDTLLVCTQVPFDYASLALPPESLHYGSDFNYQTHLYTKDIKFRGTTAIEGLEIPMTDNKLAIIDVTALSEAIVTQLTAVLQSKPENADYIDGLSHFKSARFSRFMLEGEPKVEFTVGLENTGTQE